MKNVRRDLRNKNIRKVFKRSGSYAVTIPMEMIKTLKIRDGQKMEFSRKGKRIVIKD